MNFAIQSRPGSALGLVVAAAAWCASVFNPLGLTPARAEEFSLAGVKVDVIEKKLSNGATLIMVENHESPTVGLKIQFPTGSVDEWDGISGSAHILEHALFKGTAELGTKDWQKEKALLDAIEKAAQDLRMERSREHAADPARVSTLEAAVDSLQKVAREYVISNELDRIYTEAGGQNVNAGTSWDATGYDVALPSNQLELWMKLESDRLRAPVLREFYTELGNIMEERRMRTEDEPSGPLGKLGELLFSTAFVAHRYGVPVIGWPSDIHNVTRTEVEEFFKRYYAPNRMTLAIVGNIDPQKTLEMCEAYFGTIPRQPEPFRPRTVEPEQLGERRAELEFEAEPRVMIAWHIPEDMHKDSPAIGIMDDILTGGRSGRLRREVIEKQKIAATINGYTGIPGSRYPTLYTLEATPLSPHTTQEVEQAIYAEIERLKAEPPTLDEVNASKARYRKMFVGALVDNLGLASGLAYWNAIYGDWRWAFRNAEAVTKVTPEDVQRVAATYLRKANRTVATLTKPVKEASAPVDKAASDEASALLIAAIGALGGHDALAGIKDVRTESKLVITTPGGPLEAATTKVLSTDGRSRSDLSIMGQKQTQCLDGTAGWLVTPGGVMDAPPEILSEMKNSLARDLFLWSFGPAAAGVTVRVADDEEIAGVKARSVEISLPEGDPFILHLDTNTHLPLAVTYKGLNPMTGASARVREIYGNYEKVSGVMLPRKLSTQYDGTPFSEETVTTVVVNGGTQPETFRRPS